MATDDTDVTISELKGFFTIADKNTKMLHYDLNITKKIIERSPNAFTVFMLGILSAICAIFYAACTFLLENGRFTHVKFVLKNVPGETVIDIPLYTIFSTKFLLEFLTNIIFVSAIISIYYMIKSYKYEESSFLFTAGLFMLVFPILHFFLAT